MSKVIVWIISLKFLRKRKATTDEHGFTQIWLKAEVLLLAWSV